MAAGQADVSRLRRALAAVSLPRAAGGRLVLAADITCWLRPSAHTSPQRGGMTIHVRRQIKKLNSDFVFALPKRDKERTIPMSRWVAEHLRAHRRPRDRTGI
ncbi:transposase [Microtetraspora malaysiensis]|uniref:transposase n=1 Tax=Microtetraspora malaysiensis TaxID=161358 RepID=UPI003D926E89